MQLTLAELRLIQGVMIDEFNILNNLFDTVSHKTLIEKLVDAQNKIYDLMQKISEEIERLEELEND